MPYLKKGVAKSVSVEVERNRYTYCKLTYYFILISTKFTKYFTKKNNNDQYFIFHPQLSQSYEHIHQK